MKNNNITPLIGCEDECEAVYTLKEAAKALARKGGKIGGKSTSPAKQRAARRNGNWRARKKV